MEIERSVDGNTEHVPGKDPVGDDDCKVRCIRAQRSGETGVFDARGLKQRDSVTEGDFLHRRRGEMLSPSPGFVDARDNGGNRVPCRNQRLQTRNRKVRCPHEHKPEQRLSDHFRLVWHNGIFYFELAAVDLVETSPVEFALE